MKISDNDAPVSSQQLRALSQRSDLQGLIRLGGHAVLLGLSAALVTALYNAPVLPAALLLHGVVLVFLFAPLHETVHRTAFRTRALNDAVAALCGFLLLLPAGYFRTYHLAHHRHTANPLRDPELAGDGSDSFPVYLLYVSGLPLWRERIATLLRHAFGNAGESYLDRPARVTREARLHLTLYALLALCAALAPTIAALLMWYWLAPLLLGQPLLRLFLIAEHHGCDQTPSGLQNSRTTDTTALIRFLSWNMSYHAEHHQYAAVPFFALPRLHKLVEQEIRFQSRGYWRFHRALVAQLLHGLSVRRNRSNCP